MLWVTYCSRSFEAAAGQGISALYFFRPLSPLSNPPALFSVTSVSVTFHKTLYMERREFVSNIGMTLALACVGGLAACSKSGDGYGSSPDPAPGGPNAKLSLNLSTDLPNPGDFKIANGVILIRTGTGRTAADFAALSSTCTHQGCTVATFNNTTRLIECNAPCGHGSRYSTSGAVNTGPATAPLTAYTITVSGNTLTVS